MHRSDRWVGVGLAILALAVLYSARAFPDVPGQKLGAAFLPILIGAGLLLCALALIVRSMRGEASASVARVVPEGGEHFGSALVIIAAVILYIALSERVGFLFIAPLCLLVVFRALRVSWRQALPWAIGGAVLVHFAFYKLLRVPLPWGWLPPLY